MGAQQCIMTGGVTRGHNIVVEILVPTRRLVILPFHTYEGCMNCLILMKTLFSMNINIYKISDYYISPTIKNGVE